MVNRVSAMKTVKFYCLFWTRFRRNFLDYCKNVSVYEFGEFIIAGGAGRFNYQITSLIAAESLVVGRSISVALREPSEGRRIGRASRE